MSLNRKVALVTGASRGIGRAIALRLWHDEAAIVVCFAGNAAATEEVNLPCGCCKPRSS